MSQSSASTAEKYQLKWHSHQSNLNTSISTLFKNDKYADVMLLTSNTEETFGIPAHRIVLGTSSHYFASIFDSSTTPAGSIIYIVLPPELTKRSIQTLIQYMYCGESTVSNDILNEVLRGGEILKIRGLYRTAGGLDGSDTYVPNEPNRLHHDRNSVDKQQYAEQKIVPSISTTVVTAQESPVIVKTPVQPLLQQHPSTVNPPPMPTININKEVAIDPGDHHNRSPSRTQHYDLLSPQAVVAAKKAQLSNHNKIDVQFQQTHDVVIRRPEQRKEQIVRQYASPKTIAHRDLTSRNNMSSQNIIKLGNVTPDANLPDELNFLKVKSEPLEWSDYTEDIEIGKTEMEIKPETIYTDDVSEDENMENQVYSPLTCELCSETFTVPGDWVRHIESHAECPSNVPKRRKRLEDEEADITAALKCDLCSTYFVTPAEWVRHVQSTHTETELAISNNSTMPKRNSKSLSEQTPLEKCCSVCNKSFPSYASMVIHKRTHTGERPFYCDFCNKGFNVKSNLLRHMRTLHNHCGTNAVIDQQDSTTSE